MRLVLGLFVLCLVVAPASAQSAFLSSCMTSAEGDGRAAGRRRGADLRLHRDGALAAGETAASLDRYQAFAATLDTDASGMASVAAPPEWAVATSSVLMESMGGCLTALREQAAATSAEPAGLGRPPGAATSPRTVVVDRRDRGRGADDHRGG